MAIGLSTYSFFWRTSTKVVAPLSLHDMIKQTGELGCTVLQICDYPPVETLTPSELLDIHDAAADLGIEIELGTRGIDPAHLYRYLDIAEPLGVTLVRSMLHTAAHKPSTEEAIGLLKEALPAFENHGVSVALETYEQVRTLRTSAGRRGCRVRRAGDLSRPGQLRRQPRTTARRRRPDRAVRQEHAHQRLRLHQASRDGSASRWRDAPLARGCWTTTRWSPSWIQHQGESTRSWSTGSHGRTTPRQPA